MNKLLSFAIVLCITAFASCNNNDDSQPNQRQVKYEITGNYTGKLLIVYTNNTGTNQTINNASVPWSLEVTYPTSVNAIGIGAQASIVGAEGQTATLKIFVNGNEVKSTSATAGSLGELILPTLTHSF